MVSAEADNEGAVSHEIAAVFILYSERKTAQRKETEMKLSEIIEKQYGMELLPDTPVYAMAYVPFQQWGEVYSCDKALMRGTLFPCLDLPFTMGCCK